MERLGEARYRPDMSASAGHAGMLLKAWRSRRRLSQLNLAGNAGISTRHLSFIETGRSQPSREMILHLAETLEVPLRERNDLLLAGGYAPEYSARPLEDDALAAARKAVDLVLTGLEPCPALAVDRHWNLIAANRTVPRLIEGAAPELVRPPVNVLRLSLHPEGLAPRILNLLEWRAHLLERLRRQVEATADPVLSELLAELRQYPANGPRQTAGQTDANSSVVVPLQLGTETGILRLFSTTTVFGTPLEVTVSEIAIESFFPADEETACALERLSRTVA
jgi:transcriptional regulator with XRE-family HTH domain